MSFVFHPAAAEELSAAIEWYNTNAIGLGTEFLSEIEEAIDRIISFPQLWPLVNNNYRRCLTGRFPFAIIYRINNDVIQILAIAHLSRKPGYWQKRN
ncbi:MAG: type II toxin-antitoxin system RelE/ParE family toxin [Fibrobacteres bacterium]|nr:type II toxin-antitoxin system RelE/ParE family toxin [Fibrobacterota bacterium]